MIIGISGKKQSGKDTVGSIIRTLVYCDRKPDYIKDFKCSPEELCLKIINRRAGLGTSGDIYSFQNKKFADKLKDMICILIGCTREDLEREDFKNKELGENWWYWKSYDNDSLLDYEGQNMDIKYWELIKPTPRLLLQLMGTECGRNILHPNLWVNSLMSEYIAIHHDHAPGGFEYPDWIVTDTRFPNEAEAIRSRKGLLIRVESKRCNNDDQHPSETSLDDYQDWHLLVDNDSSLEALIQKVKQFLIDNNLIKA